MSGMMDCSERRGHWGGQRGIQQGTAGQGGSQRDSFPHGQAVPGVVLLLTWASSKACGALDPITGVSCAPGMGREQGWTVTEAPTKQAKAIHGCPK